MTVPGSILASLTIRVIAGWAIISGILICIGGPSRWNNPYFDTVGLLPGSPYTWGAILALGGMLSLLGSLLSTKTSDRLMFKVKNIGLNIIATWCFIFAIGVGVATLLGANVSFTAFTRDLLVGVICIILTKATEPHVEKNRR